MASELDLTKPLPIPTPATAPFWEGLQEEKVKLQQCDSCGAWIFYPRTHCPECLSDQLSWKEVSGEGTLYTYTVARQATAPHFVDEVPQYLAMVNLKEGVRLTTTLLTDGQSKPQIGSTVLPVFDHIDENTTLLRYKPV